MGPLCVWHGNCQDGFGSAWAVRHALGDDVEFFPGVYQNDPPDVTGRNVIMVDFSYKRPVLEKMAETAASILILDHHKSALEDLKDLPVASPQWVPSSNRISALFDMDRSGAGLTWDYFHPGQPRPKLIDHIEDRDLWRFSHPNTRSVSANLFSYPYDFELWDRLIEGCEDPGFYQMFIAAGEAIERKAKQDIDNLLPVVQREMVIGGSRMPVACLPLTLTSDAGHRMASEADGCAACYWDTPEGRVFSLRSTDDGPDVSAIAKQYGGGGHRSAAGFRVSISELSDLGLL